MKCEVVHHLLGASVDKLRQEKSGLAMKNFVTTLSIELCDC
jgi:hypothetical protein